MTINSIAELYSYSGYLRSVSDPASVKRISEITTLANSNTIEKIVSQDTKADAHVNPADDQSAAKLYDYRFLPNIPLFKTSEMGKTFNETEKTSKKEEDKKSFSYFINHTDQEEAAPQQDSTGKGFYIVLSDFAPQPQKKTSFSANELKQERINNTYHLSRFKSNGTLVNLTF